MTRKNRVARFICNGKVELNREIDNDYLNYIKSKFNGDTSDGVEWVGNDFGIFESFNELLRWFRTDFENHAKIKMEMNYPSGEKKKYTLLLAGTTEMLDYMTDIYDLVK